jgi:hypothetical protein
MLELGSYIYGQHSEVLTGLHRSAGWGMTTTSISGMVE